MYNEKALNVYSMCIFKCFFFFFLKILLNTVSKYPLVPTIPEALLTSRIPYLELYAFSWLDLNQAREEIHTDCRVRHLCKPPLCEAPDQT